MQAPVWGLQAPSWAHWQLALQLKPQVPGGQGTEQLPRCQPSLQTHVPSMGEQAMAFSQEQREEQLIPYVSGGQRLAQ